jgi:hypothetical protein
MSKKILKIIKKDIICTNLLLLEKGIALNSEFPKINNLEITSSKEKYFIGDLKRYCETYKKILEHKEYFLILKDLGIIQASYLLSSDKNSIIKGSLIYYPNPGIPLGEDFSLSEEFSQEQLSQFARSFDSKYLRIDLNSESHKEILHPASHLHLGIYPTGRIALKNIPLFSEFVDFILFLYYPEEWKKFNNIEDKEEIEEYYKKKCSPKPLIENLLTLKEKLHYTLNI